MGARRVGPCFDAGSQQIEHEHDDEHEHDFNFGIWVQRDQTFKSRKPEFILLFIFMLSNLNNIVKFML